jgi:tetratricopeptide (TPR) repeat protein
MKFPPERLARLGPPIMVLVVGFALFAGTLRSPFTSDDVFIALEIPQLHNLSNIPRAFYIDLDRPPPEGYPVPEGKESRTGLYRPLLVMTYFLDVGLSGENPFGWRLTSLLLHLIAALMVLGVAGQLLGSRLGALIAALLFVAHPIHTEAVAMLIGGRSELLSCIFVLAAWWMFLYGDKHKSKRRWAIDIGSSILFLFALWSKESAAVLPGILFLSGWALRGHSFKNLVVRLLPHIAVLSLYTITRLLIIGRIAPIGWSFIFGDLSALRIFFAIMAIMAMYLRLALVPFPIQHQACYHNLPIHVSGLVGFLCTILVVFLIGVAIRQVFRGRRQGKPSFWAFGLLVFYICLIPVSHLIPFWVTMAERFEYLPSVAFCLVAGYLAVRAYSFRRWIPIAAALPVLAAYSYITIDRNADWANPDRLWSKVVACNPDFYGPYGLMGTARLRAGQPAEALEYFKQAAEIGPEHPSPHYNMGVAYHQLGRHQEAESAYRKALALAPDYSKAWNNLGMLLVAKEDISGAKKCFQQAVKTDPSHPANHVNLGNILHMEGNYQEAEKLFRLALRVAPHLTDARFNLARLLVETKRISEAEQLYRQIIENHPDHAMAHNNLANILRDRTKLDEAESHYRKALRANPSCDPAHHNLASLLLSTGRAAEALEHFSRALELKPGSIENLVGIAYVHLRRGQYSLAREVAEKAYSVSPDDPRVMELLARISKSSE